jgi:N-acetylmuramoyl-L-alanine amidase
MTAGANVRSTVLMGLGVLCFSQSAIAQPTAQPIAQPTAQLSALQVVYPPAAHTTTATQIFLIGSAPVQGEVRINGTPIRRNKSGNFSPSFPLTLGVNQFVIQYNTQTNTQTSTIAVTREDSAPKIPNTLEFGKESLYPNEPIARLPGDRICFEAIAPLGATVRVKLGNTETPLVSTQASPIALNASVLTGRTEPTTGTKPFDGRQRGCTTVQTSGIPSYELDWQGQRLTQSATGSIALLDPQNLPTIEVSAPFGTTRTGSSTDFARLTPLPQGTRAQVTGQDGAWWRLDYGSGHHVWMKQAETKELSRSSVPVTSLLGGVTSTKRSDWTDIRFPLEQPVPFSIQQSDRTLSITLHHTVSQSDISKLVSNPTIDRITWQQVTPEQITYTLQFKSSQQWGYKTQYAGNTLILSLKNPPQRSLGTSLAGIKILLDPGHGGPEDAGSRGNGGIPEKDVTLHLSKLLRDRLIQKGATVLLTREDDLDLGPNERAAMMIKTEPTIALSLHYNALPDDGDAEKTQGIATFWYQPQAQPLAQYFHDYLTNKLGRSSYGIYWDNLALTRPTIAPAVLLELGFMIHPDEYDWITNPQQQEQLADTLATGIESWFRLPR